MFTNQRYIEVNREERHFCALFVHALLSSELVRTAFIEMIRSRYGIELFSDSLEIYLEAAVLRDYWNNLGDSRRYSLETSQKRRQVLNGIVEYMGYNISAIDDNPFFWTNGIDGNKSKLWSPSHWSSSAIEASALPNLLKVKWAFNAKPDIMMISDGCALLIEGKLESLEGKYDASGQGQEETQQLIANLLKEFIPTFRQTVFHNMLLALQSPGRGRWPMSITWKDIIDILKTAPLDVFTQECFGQLQTRYYSNTDNLRREDL
ncbi:hypothetical protein [Dehalococcoides mccartyi]|uniref:hypothetical protein n=1 Tax=Dehalococcoides mccartyi TaxID=61435 RepID=UPI0019E1A651|nr:hypothetical protein [Dehalococcoides mccartyi]MBF4482338.1 hypothetical protein [Dehalococcoides mccartyi]MBJ7531699.1 hypothetical protein [Dehalococcoides mccartyi]